MDTAVERADGSKEWWVDNEFHHIESKQSAKNGNA
jgi:hypothetical protein